MLRASYNRIGRLLFLAGMITFPAHAQEKSVSKSGPDRMVSPDLFPDTLARSFLSPPASAKPWVFWYWMQTNVSKEDIRADLQTMKGEGIGGAYLMPVKGAANQSLHPSLLRWAMREAGRLGLAVHAGDGITDIPMGDMPDAVSGKMVQDKNYTLGINRLIFHVFTHNPRMDRRPIMTLDGVGLFQGDQGWWEPARAWMDYTQRCQWLLQQGRPVADIAVFAGKEISRIGLEKDFIATESDYQWATGTSGEDTASEIVIPALHPAIGIAYTHRKAPGLDIYFVSNQLDKRRIINLSLRVSGRSPELWDAVTGEIAKPEQWSQHGSRTVLPIRLEARGSLFIVLRKPAGAGSGDNKSGGSAGNENRDDDLDDTLVPGNTIDLPIVQTLHAPWTLRFDTAAGGPVGPVLFDSLQDWSGNADSTIRYYSGTTVYTQSFEWKHATPDKGGTDRIVPGVPRLWLDLGHVASIARVILNGVDCGVTWTPPYRVEITKAIKAGNNVLNIEVTNTWANRLTGDRLRPENERITWTTTPYHLDGKLQEAGLLGPVTIKGEAGAGLAGK